MSSVIVPVPVASAMLALLSVTVYVSSASSAVSPVTATSNVFGCIARREAHPYLVGGLRLQRAQHSNPWGSEGSHHHPNSLAAGSRCEQGRARKCCTD